MYHKGRGKFVLKASNGIFGKKLKSVILMTRVYTTHIYMGTIISAAMFAGNFDPLKIALMCLSVCSVLFFVNATNFYTDAEQDRLHPMTKSENPFTNKILDKRDLLWISSFYLAMSFLPAVVLGATWVLVVVAYNVIAYTYNFQPFRMKAKPYGWFLEASLSLPLCFLFPFLVSSSTANFPVWIAVAMIMFYATFAMIVSKDMPDMVADKSANDQTFPNVYGLKTTQYVLSGLSLIALTAYGVLVYAGVTSIYSLPFMFLLTIWILKNIQSEKTLRDRVSVYLRLNVFGIFFIPVVFMFGIIAKTSLAS